MTHARVPYVITSRACVCVCVLVRTCTVGFSKGCALWLPKSACSMEAAQAWSRASRTTSQAKIALPLAHTLGSAPLGNKRSRPAVPVTCALAQSAAAVSSAAVLGPLESRFITHLRSCSVIADDDKRGPQLCSTASPFTSSCLRHLCSGVLNFCDHILQQIPLVVGF